ncbi:MAG: hypothetical protein KAQ99_07930, partial [Candidatus Aureabacteria bacterium]|nr:hypothetical protein [Candidatus Auribacterota bacterium]
MNKLGGAYLNPLTFFDDQYKNGDFRQRDFWKREQKSWGKIVHKFPHKSISKVLRNGNQQNLESTADIFITTDGLIATEVPDCVTTNEEALIILSCHLSSFLSLLNLGGIYFSPVSEKELVHINFENNKLSQASGGGDNYSVVSLGRALLRFSIPYYCGTPIIGFNWVGMRILNGCDVTNCYDLGKQITNRLNFKNTEIVLSLEAYKNYTMHKWNNTLLLGWAFIEILIDKVWKKKILAIVSETEEKRKVRLKDNRTYSASVKTEILYVNNVIEIDTYNGLNKLRSIRNSLIHEGHAILETEVSAIFELTKSLVKTLTGLEPKLYNPG